MTLLIKNQLLPLLRMENCWEYKCTFWITFTTTIGIITWHPSAFYFPCSSNRKQSTWTLTGKNASTLKILKCQAAKSTTSARCWLRHNTANICCTSPQFCWCFGWSAVATTISAMPSSFFQFTNMTRQTVSASLSPMTAICQQRLVYLVALHTQTFWFMIQQYRWRIC